jgi:hypothetical protein
VRLAVVDRDESALIEAFAPAADAAISGGGAESACDLGRSERAARGIEALQTVGATR